MAKKLHLTVDPPRHCLLMPGCRVKVNESKCAGLTKARKTSAAGRVEEEVGALGGDGLMRSGSLVKKRMQMLAFPSGIYCWLVILLSKSVLVQNRAKREQWICMDMLAFCLLGKCSKSESSPYHKYCKC